MNGLSLRSGRPVRAWVMSGVTALLLAPMLHAHTTMPTQSSAPERGAIEQIVRDYLMSHPEIIEQASAVLKARQAEAQEKAAQAALKTQHAALYEHAATPVLGSATADVAVVEFFDYRCGYCKRGAPAVKALLSADKSVRVIYKELPILGPESLYASKIALAAHRQGKYEAMHLALIDADALDEKTVLALATKAGLDMERLQRDAQSTEIAAQLVQNQQLADALGVNGTPAFVIGNRMMPGALDEERLVAIVNSTRAAAKAVATEVAPSTLAKAP